MSLRRATHRLPVRLVAPAPSRVLVVAPHMDDEVIGCGGTLLVHRRLQSAVRVVFVSDSAGPDRDPAVAARMREVRGAESRAVAAALGIDPPHELGFADGSLVRHEQAIGARLADELRTFKPTQVLCPFPADGHADHQACAIAVGLATAASGWQGEVLAYEVWSTLWPNAAVDISDVAEEKARLIRLYASQMGDRDYAEAVLGLNRYRGLQHRIAFAEAFHRADAAQFRALTACLDRLPTAADLAA